MTIIIRVLFFFSIISIATTQTPVIAMDKYKWGDIDISPQTWLKKAPSINSEGEGLNSFEVDVVQVSFTRRYAAVKSLLKTDVVELGEGHARALIGPLYGPQKNKTPYLVRGVSTHYDGNMFGWWTSKTKTLEIIYNSLGLPGTQFDFSPVIVFLESKPEIVYVISSSTK